MDYTLTLHIPHWLGTMCLAFGVVICLMLGLNLLRVLIAAVWRAATSSRQ